MGCTQSKIENEEAVSRCKNRKQFMKESVSARNAFAAAHSAYAMSLKNTGAALSDYAHGEVQNDPQFSSSSAGAANSTSSSAVPVAGTQPPFVESLPPPPPPLPNFTANPPNPLQRAASMPELKSSKPESRPTDTIMEEEDEEDEEDEEEDNYEQSSSLKHRSSSQRASVGGGNRNMGVIEEQEDDGPPPLPAVMTDRAPPPMPVNKDSSWDFFWSADMPGPTLSSGVEEVGIDKEEIERNAFEERPKRSKDVVGGDGDGGRSGKSEAKVEKVVEAQVVAPPPPPVVAKTLKKTKQGVSSGMAEGKRGGKSLANVNLLEIFIKLDDHFLKASEGAHEVSKMLEATRLHYHSNFADNRGHIDHSARVMRVITWNRSFRGLPNADDGKDDFDSEVNETHATVLDKLLAWEKKLYDEVKAGELMKFEYQRKVSLLNKQKRNGNNSESLEKTKATVSHLHTRYIVDMQSLDSTVSEINRLRDDQLYPKLVALVDGMATMWETMRVHHEDQSDIVLVLRSLEISQFPNETSEHHHERTIQLWVVVQEWHAQFEKMVTHQKEYIKALNSWLKLNLIPIESSLKEKVSSPPRAQNPPIQSLLRAWHDFLDKLPDEGARSAIYNFAAIVNTIVQHQEDEMKLKEKCEDTRRDLSRKTRHFEDWYNKYAQRKMPDETDPTEDSAHTDVVLEKKMVVETLKKRLKEEEEAYKKQCLQVREKSWASLKLRLPDLFRAMSDFSLACSEMYMKLRSISHMHHNPGESSS